MNNASDANKETVLIVEDTAANYEVVQTFLNDIDVLCENAHDGMEAITKCGSVEQGYYALILMDIHLPHMDGFETAGKLREMGVKTPIIAVTAMSKEEERLRNTDRIFNFILFKPFNYLEFYTAIAPYIKNAMAYTLRLENIFEKENHFPTIDASVCDIQQAIANMGNNPRLFIKHFNHFKNNNVDLARRLQTLIEEGNRQDAAMLCHSIKGTSGMLGLTSIYRHMIRLEQLLQNDQTPDEENPGELSNGPSKPDEIHEILMAVSNDLRLVCQIQF